MKSSRMSFCLFTLLTDICLRTWANHSVYEIKLYLLYFLLFLFSLDLPKTVGSPAILYDHHTQSTVNPETEIITNNIR